MKELCQINDWGGGQGEGYVHKFEAQGHNGITAFVLSKGCASGVRKKRGW